MTDRIKINTLNRAGRPTAFWPHSRLWARFSRYLEQLLVPRFRTTGFPPGAAYIDRPDERQKLEESLSSDQSFLRFILGPTGIGKSTLIGAVLPKHNQVHVDADKGEIFIPIYCSGRSIIDDLFTMSLRAVAEEIDRAFKLTFSDERYEEFLREHRRELLHAELLPDDAAAELSVEALKRTHPYADAVARLKARLHTTAITHVVIVCDDIEALELGTQANVLQQLGRLHAFLCDEKPLGLRVHAFFACRPTSFLELKGQTEPKLSPFMGETLMIEIAEAVPVGQVIEQRFALLTNHGQPDGVKNLAEWQAAYESLMRLSARLRGADEQSNPNTQWLENLIVSLCNYDMAAAFGEYLMLLTNSRYLEREHLRRSTGPFHLDTADYDLSDTAIYRALAMRDRSVYPGWETKISNIFENWPAPESDLIVAYVLRYIERSEGKLRSEDFLLEVLFALHPFLQRRADWVKLAVEKLCSEGALLWENSRGRLLYLSPRAKTIMRTMQETSVLLDFARDDTWLPRSATLGSQPTQQLKEDEKILARIEFVKHVTAVEHQHLLEVQQDGATALSTYTACFAPLLSKLCLSGLRSTLHQHYERRNLSVPSAIGSGLAELKAHVAQNDRIIG